VKKLVAARTLPRRAAAARCWHCCAGTRDQRRDGESEEAAYSPGFLTTSWLLRFIAIKFCLSMAAAPKLRPLPTSKTGSPPPSGVSLEIEFRSRRLAARR
jgi:hypothetical protein